MVILFLDLEKFHFFTEQFKCSIKLNTFAWGNIRIFHTVQQQQRCVNLVYYYGGTSPTTRDFGGRYPKNLYAAQGCVVYVLQPSGATGFGQEFSARLVND
ncbi:unnamed protein product, partial [marine sediment metagenome]